MKCNKQEHDCHLGLFTKMPLGQLDLHNLSNLLEKKKANSQSRKQTYSQIYSKDFF